MKDHVVHIRMSSIVAVNQDAQAIVRLAASTQKSHHHNAEQLAGHAPMRTCHTFTKAKCCSTGLARGTGIH
jgi:hypothetical protein